MELDRTLAQAAEAARERVASVLDLWRGSNVDPEHAVNQVVAEVAAGHGIDPAVLARAVLWLPTGKRYGDPEPPLPRLSGKGEQLSIFTEQE